MKDNGLDSKNVHGLYVVCKRRPMSTQKKTSVMDGGDSDVRRGPSSSPWASRTAITASTPGNHVTTIADCRPETANERVSVV